MHATRIVAIRHGETAWNVDTRIQGHLDIPLNDTGLWQAAQVAQALVGEPIAAIYSSDLQRAHATAQAVVYETSAVHEDVWVSDPADYGVLFDAALDGFPKPPQGPRQVRLPLAQK